MVSCLCITLYDYICCLLVVVEDCRRPGLILTALARLYIIKCYYIINSIFHLLYHFRVLSVFIFSFGSLNLHMCFFVILSFRFFFVYVFNYRVKFKFLESVSVCVFF